MGGQSGLGPPEILYEDAFLIGLNKPAGIPTANAPRGRASIYTLLRGRAAGSRANGDATFCGIVSRLDAPVSGVLVVAKTPAAAAGLAHQFRDRAVEKQYLAVVTGRFPGALDAWVDWHDQLQRDDDDPRTAVRPASRTARDAVPEDVDADGPGPGGLAAHVRARVVRRAGEVSLVELVPTTGRRHQLRVQLAARGCPIVGDRLYGSRLPFPDGGVALHARSLAFDHPHDGRRLTLEAPVPPGWKTRFPSLFR